ncbi:MAG: VOC family protein [Halioglobus sp.]|nr:VOC family protein [Halioglobus sp.]
MSTAFSRTTLFCRDIEKSLQLYRDTLGLQVIDDKTLEGAAAGALLGLGPCTLRIVLLTDSGGHNPTVGLFQVSGIELPSLAEPPARMALGQTATVFATDRFDELVETLRGAGTAFLTEPLTYPKKQASPGSPAGLYKEVICFDPDGNLVSLMQILPLTDN